MHFTLLTLFPEMFPGTLGFSIAGKALKEGVWQLDTVNIRDYAKDKHGTVDDAPYGGGTGMVMRPDVLGSAIDDQQKKHPNIKWLYMSPRGRVLDQAFSHELTGYEHIGILCGRYEGVDQRILDVYDIEEVSIGDYILSGGEVAAQTVMDSCIRLLPGVISKESALFEESFGQMSEYTGLLEYPLYTRPSQWQGHLVPDVLCGGNHQQIAQWRLEQSKVITKQRRPDLWKKYKHNHSSDT